MGPKCTKGILRRRGLGLFGLAAVARLAPGANHRIVVGVIGCGGQAGYLGRTFAAQPDVRVA